MATYQKVRIPGKRSAKGDVLFQIDKFLAILEGSAELQLFKSEQKPLMQVFKGRDVKEWGIDLHIPKGNSTVLMLKFKLGNNKHHEHLINFYQSEYADRFEEYRRPDEKIYIAAFSKKAQIKKIIKELILTTYGLHLHEIKSMLLKY